MRQLQILSALVLVLGLVVSSGACTKLRARTPEPPPPSLTTPDPPSRLVIPIPVEPPEPPPASTTDKPAPVTTGRPTGNRVTPPATPPTAPPVETTPPPVLQTGGSSAELEARTRERLDRAQKDLGRVSRDGLGNNARDQYDSALRFIRMAKDAMTARNFPYAHYCADKAATLASQLVKEPEPTSAL